MATQKTYLSVKEAAARLGVSQITVRRMIKRGVLRALQLGGPGSTIRITLTELDRLPSPGPQEHEQADGTDPPPATQPQEPSSAQRLSGASPRWLRSGCAH